MELECQSCGYEWDYKGKSDFYATCPNCHYKVKIPAEAEVVESEGKRNKKEVNISASAEVVHPDVESTKFDKQENQLIDELKDCDDFEDLEKVYAKYDQEEFNVMKKKIKGKANQIRNDLNKFEEVEDLVEETNWEFSEL